MKTIEAKPMMPVEPYSITEQELAVIDQRIYLENDIVSIPKARRGFRVRGGKSFFYFCDAMHHARLLRLQSRVTATQPQPFPATRPD